MKNIDFFMKIQAFYRFYEQNKGFIGLTQNYRLLQVLWVSLGGLNIAQLFFVVVQFCAIFAYTSLV